jgi:UDP-glucose 4-epimerase
MPRRAGDPPILVADVTRSRELLGWSARLSDLDSILSTAWAWHLAADGAERAAGD